MSDLVSPVQQLRTALANILIREEGDRLVLLPTTTEEVASVLQYCNANDLPVEISGARTKRGWTGASEAQVVLDTSRLSGVREHPWQDLTATVGAGTPWAEMQRTLAAHKQFVALDPLWPERATVGGVLAANDSGAVRLLYGSARDLVIGMTIVLADGTIARTGGKVVKNVAGYDLHKLMIGAFGTLAVITEVTFRLHPLPAERAAYSVSAPTPEPLASLSAAISSAHLNPEALQLRTSPDGFALDILLAAGPDILRSREEALAALASSHSLAASLSSAEPTIFSARESLFHSGSATIVKATMLQTAIPAAVGELARSGASVVAYPLGILYASCESPDRVPEAFVSLVRQSEGAITILGQPDPPTPLMREIKNHFDPNRILNRGLLGGI